MSEFQEFPKMARLSRECIISEKIDGTNAQVLIVERDELLRIYPGDFMPSVQIAELPEAYVFAGSRTKWITPADDNHGFAKWVQAHAEELATLGPGRHFGEWWGQGIQRKYGLSEKRWSLFNTIRWCAHGARPEPIQSGDPRAEPKYQTPVPACCHVVPVVYRGMFDTRQVDAALAAMQCYGSRAAPGFMKPEGVVVFHVAGNVGFKKTLDSDGAKGHAYDHKPK